MDFEEKAVLVTGAAGAIGKGIAAGFARRGARVFITDLNPDNIGKTRFGVEIWDGADRTADLVEAADVIILTGTTLVNGTFDAILNLVRDLDKDYLVYGVTTAGVTELLGFERVCPYGRDG